MDFDLLNLVSNLLLFEYRHHYEGLLSEAVRQVVVQWVMRANKISG